MFTFYFQLNARMVRSGLMGFVFCVPKEPTRTQVDKYNAKHVQKDLQPTTLRLQTQPTVIVSD